MRPDGGEKLRDTPRWFRDALRFSTRHKNCLSADSWAAKRLRARRPDLFFSSPLQSLGVPRKDARRRLERRAAPANPLVCDGGQAAHRAPRGASGGTEEEVVVSSDNLAFPSPGTACWSRGPGRIARRGVLHREATSRGYPRRHGCHLFSDAVGEREEERQPQQNPGASKAEQERAGDHR